MCLYTNLFTVKYAIIYFINKADSHTIVYPTEKWEGAWSLREIGSTRAGGMGESPAPQVESKISR
jgi:hypothetical protein